MNLNAGASFGVPRGFPVRLSAAGESILSGVIPRGIASVTATLATEIGTASAHLALCTMPTTSGGNDNAIVAQSDVTGLTTKAGQTISISVPDVTLCYIVKLWVDKIAGSSSDTISRDGSTAAANEPRIPSGVVVSSITVT